MKINICGIFIQKKKLILFGLTKIYGIGIKLSKKICNKLNIDKKINFFNIDNEKLKLLCELISSINIENELRIFEKENIKKILILNNYKSFRHKKKLPCRGQRTKTNAKTRKKMLHEKI